MTRLFALLLFLASPVFAGEPQIVDATAKRSGMGWRISVTLVHGDETWDTYADGWEVRDVAGQRLGYRELMHPHTPNQPFTRSLPSVMIPDGTRKVKIRARCKGEGWGEQVYILKLR
jgi:hypothetical protein